MFTLSCAITTVIRLNLCLFLIFFFFYIYLEPVKSQFLRKSIEPGARPTSSLTDLVQVILPLWISVA